MSEVVQLERPSEGVAVVTMNNPAIGNFGSFEAVDQLAARCKEAREGGARIVVLASAVEDVWFQHAWLRDLGALFSGEETSGSGAGFFKSLVELTSPEVVTIAAINGDCAGGGIELGWACDLRVAEEQALISQPEVMINLATGIGGTCRLMRLIGPTVTAEMVLDGAPVTASRLYELGGINRVVERGNATTYCIEWAKRLAERPHASLKVLKQMLLDAQNLHLDEAMQNEQKLFQTIAPTPDARAQMKALQARFDQGETPRQVYGGPRD